MDAACNIGGKGVRRRMTLGVVLLLVGAGAGWAARDLAPGWRIGLFLPFFAGFLGVLQATART